MLYSFPPKCFQVVSKNIYGWMNNSHNSQSNENTIFWLGTIMLTVDFLKETKEVKRKADDIFEVLKITASPVI